MTTTNATRTDGNDRRSDEPSGEAAAHVSPYHAITVTRSYEGVVRQIAASIRTGRLSSGERLPTERELATAFGVSRGVVREAVKVLGALGLVEARQGSGIYVINEIPTVTRAFTLSVSPDAESVEQLFEFRCTLESDAARFAALRRSAADLAAIETAANDTAAALSSMSWRDFGVADHAFHAAIARATGNPFFEVAVATARQMQTDVVPLIADRVGSMRSAVAHHRAIADAIAARDADQAARAMTAHIVYTANAVVRQDRDASDPAATEGPA